MQGLLVHLGYIALIYSKAILPTILFVAPVQMHINKVKKNTLTQLKKKEKKKILRQIMKKTVNVVRIALTSQTS